MRVLAGRTPFSRLLLPVIAGIAAASLYWCQTACMILPGAAGILGMLFSLFVGEERQYKYRWIFGAGLSLFLFSLAATRYHEQEKKILSDFPATEQYFIGSLIDIPEEKPRSIACHIKTTYPVETRVILYLEQSDEARLLSPGDELVFRAKLQPFRNFGNPDDFNYKRFMKIKGFSGSSYVPAMKWKKTGRQQVTLFVLSQHCRAKLLAFYQSFRLDPDAFAFISAVTLGYKTYLSDDLQAAFRASGTAHVLAVSGLHVGIIYMVINLLFSFLGKRGNRFKIRQLLIIITLWAYALVAGMSAPVVRAAFMLTIYCAGRAWRQTGFTYNTLAAAAFFLLLYKPFNLFDVSFQMSFLAVFAILFFQPIIKRLYSPRNKVTRYIWDLSTVSLSAQLSVFPLVLYHFGNFPTYFFIANLLVVPLLSLVIYAILPLVVLTFLSFINSTIIEGLKHLLQWVLETLIEIILQAVYFTETLPFAQLTDKYISFFQLLLLLGVIFLFTRFLVSRGSRSLIIALTAALAFFTITAHRQAAVSQKQLVVFNHPSASDIGLFVKNRRHFVEIPLNGLLPHPEKSILRLSDDSLERFHAEKQLPLDILILSHYQHFNLDQLLSLFSPGIIVLDSSIPRYTANRLHQDCHARDIPLHDVSREGAYSVFF